MCSEINTSIDCFHDCYLEFDSMPRLDIMSATTNIPHLTVSDIDHNMPSEINFNYYSPTEFHNNDEISKHRSSKHSFSLLHCKIRSLSKIMITLLICCLTSIILFELLV